VPIIAGSILILNGITHILVSACFLVKIPVSFFDEVQSMVGFSDFKNTGVLVGIFLGFCLLIVGKGVCYRKRRSWFFAVVILIILIVNNILLNALPQTNLLSIVLLIGLLSFYRKK